ncbi:DNRLRE domain-containing protein, partial [Candidatus Omnitrophota bacterium]
CMDRKDCGTARDKPAESEAQSCEIDDDESEEEGSQSSRNLSSGEAYSAIDDAYLQEGVRFNNEHLKVENTSVQERIGYIKFDVTSTDVIKGAKLSLKVSRDPGLGTIKIYQGSHNSWNEENLAVNSAPIKAQFVTARPARFKEGLIYEFDVSSLVKAAGMYTFIVEMNFGDNDVWFGSKESGFGPELMVDVISEE